MFLQGEMYSCNYNYIEIVILLINSFVSDLTRTEIFKDIIDVLIVIFDREKNLYKII